MSKDERCWICERTREIIEMLNETVAPLTVAKWDYVIHGIICSRCKKKLVELELVQE